MLTWVLLLCYSVPIGTSGGISGLAKTSIRNEFLGSCGSSPQFQSFSDEAQNKSQSTHSVVSGLLGHISNFHAKIETPSVPRSGSVAFLARVVTFQPALSSVLYISNHTLGASGTLASYVASTSPVGR